MPYSLSRMDHDGNLHGRISVSAAAAAVRLVRRLGIERVDPFILHASQHVSIRLLPLDMVARVVSVDNPEAVERLRRELAVARHLTERSAPVVAPVSKWPAGPYFDGGFGLTLWRFVRHGPADGDNPDHVRRAGGALRLVHEVLADFPGQLPLWWSKIDQCRALLENEAALPALRPADRAFLVATYRTLQASLDRLPTEFVPIHGDAHLGNVFMTSDTALWNDFEDVCIGPREWDIVWLPDADLAAFEPINREALSVLSYLRSLCVSVWCWALFDRPENREAAEYHLGYLRDHFAG